MVRERFYQFSGTDAEYILFLEKKLREAERSLHQQKDSQSATLSTRTLFARSPLRPSQSTQNTLHQISQENGPPLSLSSEPGLHSPPLSPCLGDRRDKTRNELRLVPYVPSGSVRHHHHQKLRWQQDMDKFLLEIPDMSRWVSKRKEMKLASVVDNQNAIGILLMSSVNMYDLPADSTKRVDLLEIANGYASFTKRTQEQGRLVTKLGLFQKLIFVSLCAVLVKIGISQEAVNLVMHVCISNSETKNLDRLRRGGIWVNQCISELSKTYWKGGQPVGFYGRYGEGSKSLPYFIEHLTKRKCTDVVSEPPGWIPFSIPCIIKSLLGDSIVLADGQSKDSRISNLKHAYEFTSEPVPRKRKKTSADIDHGPVDRRDAELEFSNTPLQQQRPRSIIQPSTTRLQRSLLDKAEGFQQLPPSSRLEPPISCQDNAITLDPASQFSAENQSDINTSLSISAFASRTSTPQAFLPQQCPSAFDRLDNDSKDLATLMVFLGVADVAERMLLCARGPLRVWGSNGEIEQRAGSDLITVLTDGARFELAIQSLESYGFIISKPGPFQLRSFSVYPQLRLYIGEHTPNPNRWKIQAAKVVFHAFPKHRHIDPLLYTAYGISTLPQLEWVLSYLDELDVIKELPLAQAAEVYISSSYFSTADWKQKAIKTAEKIMKTQINDPDLCARVKLRKKALSRIFLFEPRERVDQSECNLGRVDKRSNAYFGESVLFNVQELIDRNELRSARSEIERYKPLDAANISTLEQIQIYEALFMLGKIDRFGGQFRLAEQQFQELLTADPSRSGMLCRVVSHLSAVQCELCKATSAVKLVLSELENLKCYQSLENGNGKRLRLALADAYLMQALWTVVHAGVALIISGHISLPKDTRDSLASAKVIYERLRETYQKIHKLGKVGKMNLFWVSAGLAIIAHVEGRLEAALALWENASDAAEDCNWAPGYVEMIIAYSKSELSYRLGRFTDAYNLEQNARDLYKKTGRRYYFIGLGSVWPDLIGNLVEHGGGNRVIPRQDQGSLAHS
ncbi:MAG: hypothetical protein M1834_009016 [Cirrosporium novae-zelandiae]|nr:MAG: hypothetical protein M1834_009016 [Cirrosporium novae-zelandiae]